MGLHNRFCLKRFWSKLYQQLDCGSRLRSIVTRATTSQHWIRWVICQRLYGTLLCLRGCTEYPTFT